VSETRRGFRKPGRGGGAVAVLVAVLIAIGTGAFAVMSREEIEPYLVYVLGAFAVFGVFALLALAAGLLRFGERRASEDTVDAGVVDALPEAVLVADARGDALFANTAYKVLADADLEGGGTIVGAERLLAGVSEASETLFRLAKAAQDGTIVEEEVRLPHPIGRSGGGARWYRMSVRPLGGDRRIWRIFDVTSERRDQETSFLDLQNAIDFLDHAPAGFFSADPAGRIVYLNATLAEWLGYDLAAVDPGRIALRDIVSGDGAALLSALSGRPGDARTEQVDVDLVRRDGQALPVRLLHRVGFGADGGAGDSRTLVLSRAAGADASESLRAAEVRFSRFFNNTPLAIASVDREGRIGRSNAPFAKLFGGFVRRSPGEPRPLLISAVAERDRPRVAEALAAAIAGQSAIAPVEASLSERGDRSVRFFLSAVQDAQPAGDDEAAIVYALDTTEQRALETQFAQSQKMQAIGQLAGGVAHDFNNMLTAIIGFSDLLLQSHRPNDPFFQDIMNIKQNANRAAGLVGQLLAFSRQQTLRPERVVINDVLADLNNLLGRLLGEKVQLKIVHGRDLWPVMADANQLNQVFLNLAVNARDAMPDGGRLLVRTANVPSAEALRIAAEGGQEGLAPGDYVMIEIADSGVGMSAEVREKIFEPFFTTKDVGKGTGLGLSTVYGIVKQSGGAIAVESAPGAGTTFRVLLPRAAAEATRTGGDAAASAAARRLVEAFRPDRGLPAPLSVAAEQTTPAVEPAAAPPATVALAPSPREEFILAEPSDVEFVQPFAAAAAPQAPAWDSPVWGTSAGGAAARSAPDRSEAEMASTDTEPARRERSERHEVAPMDAMSAPRAHYEPAPPTPRPPVDRLPPAAPPATDLTGTASILLVEDEEAVRAFAARALTSRGYTVHQAASGAEALRIMGETGGRVDLVVSDVVMPEMDGPTLLRELRKTQPGLKIVFVSGYAEDAFARNLPDNESFSFLPKPFTLKQLATAVKAALSEPPPVR
jgi:two-component system cell cycle sensor histidine kinase/response regulator CckA